MASFRLAFSWALLVLHFCTISGAPDNRGKEFIIGYMENLIWGTFDVELFITTSRTTTVNVKVTAPKYPSLNVNHNFQVTAGVVKQVFINRAIRQEKTGLGTKGVLIQADDEVVIYGANKESYSCDVFLGLPTDILENEYYVVSWYPPSRQTELLVVGVNDTTSVRFTVGPNIGSGFITWGGNRYYKNQQFSVNINRFDTLSIASPYDITGTYIKSDKPVSVFSGNQKTKIGAGGSQDHLVEHLTPVSTWGKRFITVPIPTRTTGDYFRIIASEDSTTLSITGYYTIRTTISKAGQFYQKLFSSSAYCYIESDKPVLVVQFVLSQQSSGEPSDPSMLLIPPVEQYAADYTYATPKYSQGSYANYYMFVVKESEKDGLRIDGKVFPSTTRYNRITGTDYVGGYISVSEGTHTVRHTSPISVFGGFMYGQAPAETYGVVTGMRLAGINTVCVPTPTVVGDGIDNDCDGLIDEEMCTPENRGKDDDGDGVSEEDCATPPPVDGAWGAWGSYSSCSISCVSASVTSGTKSRSRLCNNPTPKYDGKQCPGSGTETVSCSPSLNCPVNGGWGSWGSYGTCSKTCGTGIQTKRRSCNNPAPAYNGANCPGDSFENRDCNTYPCPVDGGWSSWGAYSTCSLTCGGGTQRRTRSCNNPAPAYNGAQCSGDAIQNQNCNTQNCPVDGAWGSWSSYATCPVTCGGGSQSRTRACNNPAPAYGGAQCPGDATESQSCNTNNCPIDGGFTAWATWTTCTVTCGGGTKGRTRTCTNPAPAYGGAQCSGDTSESTDCNTQICIIDGSWGNWGSWGTCTRSCNNGTQSRSRVCDDPPPLNGGLGCPGTSSDFQDCNTQDCPVPLAGQYFQKCPSGYFTCEAGIVACIGDTLKCDCQPDCDDESDESATYANCSSTHVNQCLLRAGTSNLSVNFVLLALLTAMVFALFNGRN